VLGKQVLGPRGAAQLGRIIGTIYLVGKRVLPPASTTPQLGCFGFSLEDCDS